MMQQDMPTLDGENPGGEPELGLLATHFGGKAPLGERFRRAQLRAQMFGDPGETLSIGRYRITGQIGAGSMGTVYRAVDPSLDREVAVKILHRSDEVHRARMTIEAKALAKLSHPNVVTVHEVGTEDGQLFVAMELVQGKTLHAWLEEPTGPRVLEVFVQAAEGLQAAHDAGIVHRDFKPENVIVGDDGRVRVLDFGMARSPGAPLLREVDGKAAEHVALEPAITRTGLLAGTPAYMAPEQFEGSRVDARADQFAFCIALHEAIWRTRPFVGETVAELAKAVLNGEMQLFVGNAREDLEPHELEAAKAVIERGLKTEPAERFGSMLELAGRLRGVPALRRRRPSRARPFFGALSAAALGAGGLLFLTVQRDAEPEAVLDGVEAVLSNRCGETIRYAFGDENGPSRPAYDLEQGRSLPVRVSNERRVWVLDDTGTRRISGWTDDEGQELTIGPSCTQIATGPFGTYRAVPAAQMLADAEDKRCGLGTELRDGACLPLEGDPVRCDAEGCTIRRDSLQAHHGEESVALRGLRVVPSADAEGNWLGMKVLGVAEDTSAHIVGLRSGDVVTAINDVPLTSMEAIVPIEEQLFLEKVGTLRVEFERDGESRSIRVNIED